MSRLGARLVLLTATLGLTAATAVAADFRGLEWGATPKEVKDAEEASFAGVDGTDLYYTTSLAGIDVVTRYHFLDGRLAEAAYLSTEEYINDNRHVEDYMKLKELLTDKYGAPVDDDVIWKSDLFKGETSALGTAVSSGHLVLQTIWEAQDTTIRMVLRGEGFDISHGIIYSEKATAAERERREAQRARDQL